jgi:transcriptional regulator with GAF, ATPase, and Fis domain
MTPERGRTQSTVKSTRRRIVRAPVQGRLRIVSPPECVATIPIGEEPLTLGRGTGRTAIDHLTVSRRHLQLIWSAPARTHVVEELGSRNGSFLDGEPLDAAAAQPLNDNAVLRLGDVLVVYEAQTCDDGVTISRDEIAGDAAATRRLRAELERAAADPSPVLLLGETGTGKEHAARELHRLSGRRGELVTVNCAAVGAQLSESELFGHLRGAFTGAVGDHEGLVRAAAHGTLLLDEVGELPLALQAKLLRTIESGEVRPVGSARPQRVDVRVIAATNQEVAAAVSAGGFRRDLYARLSLWEIRVPALRARRSDLFEWIEVVGRAWQRERGRPGEGPSLLFDAEAAEVLLLYDWPNNLRSVARLVHELAAAPTGTCGAEALPEWLLAAAATPAPAETTAEGAALPPPPTREELLRALRAHQGSFRAVARQFRRHRNQVYRWMQQYHLSRADL